MYKSNTAFLLKNEVLFRRFSLFTKFFFTSVRWCDQESLSSIVTPRRGEYFTHSIRSSPIVTEFSGPMCGFLINSIASHFAEWGVKEFSRHKLFSSDKALFKEVTVLSTVSPMQWTVMSSAYIKTEPELTALGRSLVYKANNVGPSTDPWGIPQVTFSTVER